MSKKRVCLAVLLDRSGSMQVNKAETISAFNQYIDNIRNLFKGLFTLTQFDSNGIDKPQDGVKIKEAVHLNDETYQPRGGTPLLDAIGKTVNAMDTEGFDNVIFVIITDGQENASAEYSTEAIKALLTEKSEKYGWQISYLGANVDAFHEARQLGIAKGQAMNFVGAQSVATMDAYSTSNAAYASRSSLLAVGEADFTDEQREQAMTGKKKGKEPEQDGISTTTAG